jgi:hypothetical protein
MVELRILTGSRAGSVVLVSETPFSIGRSHRASLTLADPGIWDRHAVLERDPDCGFKIRAEGAAMLVVEGNWVREHSLRNGDILECGAARLRFSLGAPVQRTGNWMVWAAFLLLAAVTILELAIMASWFR